MSIFTLRSAHYLQKFYYIMNLNGNPNQVTNTCYIINYSTHCTSFPIKYYPDFFVTIGLENKLENQGLKRLYMTFSASHG